MATLPWSRGWRGRGDMAWAPSRRSAPLLDPGKPPRRAGYFFTYPYAFAGTGTARAFSPGPTQASTRDAVPFFWK